MCNNFRVFYFIFWVVIITHSSSSSYLCSRFTHTDSIHIFRHRWVFEVQDADKFPSRIIFTDSFVHLSTDTVAPNERRTYSHLIKFDKLAVPLKIEMVECCSALYHWTAFDITGISTHWFTVGQNSLLITTNVWFPAAARIKWQQWGDRRKKKHYDDVDENHYGFLCWCKRNRDIYFIDILLFCAVVMYFASGSSKILHFTAKQWQRLEMLRIIIMFSAWHRQRQ